MEYGLVTLCFRRVCFNSCRGGRFYFLNIIKSMLLDRKEVIVNYCFFYRIVVG